jgi:hypothetical protein
MKKQNTPTGQADRTLPVVTVATAEKTLRDIARRNGEVIRKRRSFTLKKHFGDGYCILDLQNRILSGARMHDGCDLSLAQLAAWYKDKANTPWQKTVIQSAIKGRVAEEAESA